MNRGSSTRGHWLIAIGAILIVGATMLQWWQIGGGPGELPAVKGVGIADGRVFLGMFVPSVAALLLVTLPFVSEKPIAIDHPLVYLAFFATILIGYGWYLFYLYQKQILPWPPQQGIGPWIAAAGMVLFARGIFEVFEEGRRRLY
jgi:hypothetical protein